jgi:glutamyl-tRNA synthetase
MQHKNVRVRFAPSPTGPLHMGGVRTAMYNYLFARANGGKFILRIEDTDRTRFVDGAEQYVVEALKWCGLKIDEGCVEGGGYGPYKQSLRSDLYNTAVASLLDSGAAYRAFDTPEELTDLRTAAEKKKGVFQYDASTRGACKNELSLSEEEVKEMMDSGAPYVVRFRTPDIAEDVVFTDEIRGEVSISSAVVDDKVLMKTDGLPTYHLANVVDDHHMEISHVIRGEEWLPSAPLHILLYRASGWDSPKFAHLPLILKPEGNGKLSKRDGDAGGFPVFPIEWKDPKTGAISAGYRERGYDSAAFMNMLLMLGWNPGGEREKFSIEDASKIFTLDRIVKSGARFSPDKAKWFNELYLRETPHGELASEFVALAAEKNIELIEAAAKDIVKMMIDRVSFLHEILEAKWLFASPEKLDFNAKMIRKKWKPETASYLAELKGVLETIEPFEAETIEERFKDFLEEKELGFGQVLLPFRLALTGAGSGPSMFEFAEFLGKEKTLDRLSKGVANAEALKAESTE